MANEGNFFVSENDINDNEMQVLEVGEDEIENEPDFNNYFPDEDGDGVEDKDWLTSKDPKHFLDFLNKEISRFIDPNSTRGNLSLIEQSLGQWKRLNSYISKALREDYDGILDIAIVDSIRTKVERNVDRLEDMLDGIYALKKKRKQLKRRSEDEGSDLVKEAATAPFLMTITPFQKAISAALINAVVTNGKNIEELWKRTKEKYDMDSREELEMLQILSDMGYPVFKDRLLLGEEVDTTENDGEWQKQYYA